MKTTKTNSLSEHKLNYELTPLNKKIKYAHKESKPIGRFKQVNPRHFITENPVKEYFGYMIEVIIG